MKFLLILAAAVFVYLFLSVFILCRIRRSDKKAKHIFRKRNVPLEIFNVTVNDRNIHYVSSGATVLPTMIFIHGTPASWFRFQKLMLDDDLRKKFRVISIDRPGFGYSDFGKPLHLQEQCRLLLPLIQKLKNDRPMFLCGHSYGGAVVAQLAADSPELFDTVIIVAGALDPAQEKNDYISRLLDKKPLSWFLPGAYKPSLTELLWFKKDLQHLSKDLDKIKAHVLFIHGDKDKNVPISNIAYGKKMMTHAASVNIATLENATHQLPLSNSREIKNILLNLDTGT